VRVIIFGRPLCSGCQEAKAKLRAAGIDFEERPMERLNGDHENWDMIDVDGLAELCLRDGVLPVVVLGKALVDVEDRIEDLRVRNLKRTASQCGVGGEAPVQAPPPAYTWKHVVYRKDPSLPDLLLTEDGFALPPRSPE